MKRIAFALTTLAIMLLITLPVAAGGWATIELHTLPKDVEADTVTPIEFTIWQHGQTPVHKLSGWDNGKALPLQPTVTLVNRATGEELQFTGQPMKEVGRFMAEVTIPNAGEWEWTIEATPLAGELTPDTLNVRPNTKPVTVSPAIVTGGFSLQTVPVGVLAVTVGILLVGALFLVHRTTRRTT
ncbi:MAG: hypothetical protein M9965_13815 [Anaerolineae bacterium]|nr:hypothetical protein [Anaerolineae bacterium]